MENCLARTDGRLLKGGPKTPPLAHSCAILWETGAMIHSPMSLSDESFWFLGDIIERDL